MIAGRKKLRAAIVGDADRQRAALAWLPSPRATVNGVLPLAARPITTSFGADADLLDARGAVGG